MVDIMAQLQGILPAVKTFAIVFVGGIIVVGAAYWFLIASKRKKWMLNIFEMTSDGRLHLIGKDTLVEKRLDHGRVVMYWLQKLRQETTPPPAESVDRLGNQNYADYLRIRHAVIPIVKQHEAGTKAQMQRMVGTAMDGMAYKALHAIKTDKKYQTTLLSKPTAVENRFIYVPISKVPHVEIAYNQVQYDVDMMRINMIDNLDKQFAGTKDFWQKYGMFMMIGFLVVAVIVIAYLAFDFMSGVIQQNLDKTDNVIKAIQSINLGGGGTPPQ